MIRVIVTQGNAKQTIDNVIQIDELMGDLTPIVDRCGSIWTGVRCPGCIENGEDGCGELFVVARIMSEPYELWINAADGDHCFVGDDVKFEVIRNDGIENGSPG